jgi:hypothetical protein
MGYLGLLCYFLILFSLLYLILKIKIKLDFKGRKVVFCISYDRLTTEGYLETIVKTYIFNFKR